MFRLHAGAHKTPRRIVELADKVRASRPDVENLTPTERRVLIQIVLMDEPGADPDNVSLLKAVDAEIMNLEPILPRVKAVTGLSDRELAELVGKSRPTVQAYISGRLDELLPPSAYAKLADKVESKASEIGSLLSELRSAGAAA